MRWRKSATHLPIPSIPPRRVQRWRLKQAIDAARAAEKQAIDAAQAQVDGTAVQWAAHA